MMVHVVHLSHYLEKSKLIEDFPDIYYHSEHSVHAAVG